MRYKLILALALAFVALAPLAAPVRRVEARTALVASPFCVYAGFKRLECHADAEGGTGIYTYQWSPQPAIGQGQEIAIIGCGTGYKTVYLTVTDSSGATFSASTSTYCGGYPQ